MKGFDAVDLLGVMLAGCLILFAALSFAPKIYDILYPLDCSAIEGNITGYDSVECTSFFSLEHGCKCTYYDVVDGFQRMVGSDIYYPKEEMK